MPTLSLNVGETLPLSGRVETIEVRVGQVLITDTGGSAPTSVLVDAASDDENAVIHDCGGSPSIVLHSVTGSSLEVVYELDNAVAPTRAEMAKGISHRPDRGEGADADSPAGGTGPFEDRTVPELKATAEKRGIDLGGATKKADIIAKLREG